MSKGTLDTEAAARSPLPVGQCHLLAIAIDDYTEAPLYNCVSDAEAVAKALQTHYGFSTDHIRFLRNAEADAEAIYDALEYYAQHLTEHDSLIIYFSGHGKLHEQLGDGYWLPAGCQFHKYRSQGIPNDEIRKRIALQKARHVLLLVDSCFAGSLFAHKNAPDGTERDPHAAERHKSRWAITAGRKEPVSDGQRGQKSPFAQKLLQYLEKDGSQMFTAAELGIFLVKAVGNNAAQTPDARALQNTGDDGGHFVFRRVPLERADTLAFRQAKASGDLDELELFLDEHENSPHKPEAKRLIKEIKALRAWQQAEKEHSIDAYDDYLEQYPHGTHAETAKQHKRDLAEQKRRARAAADAEKQRLMAEAAPEVVKEAPAIAETAPTGQLFKASTDAAEVEQYISDARFWLNNGHSKLGFELLQLILVQYPDNEHLQALLLEAQAKYLREQEEAEKQRLAEEAARPQNGSTHRDGPNLPVMVFVEGGKFSMGSNSSDYEKPIHEVTVSNFFIGQYPVTFEEYDTFCKSTQREKPDDEGWNRGRRPVINVSWEDARAYCQWLSALTKKSYRLPTEAEWEYAARGGNLSNGFEYAGSNNLDEVGWYNKNIGYRTEPVGKKKPNELGLYDMSGNVWEWCEDDWHDNYEAAPNDGKAWIDGGGRVHRRVLRGGSWLIVALHCRVANRASYASSRHGNYIGFRLVSPA